MCRDCRSIRMEERGGSRWSSVLRAVAKGQYTGCRLHANRSSGRNSAADKLWICACPQFMLTHWFDVVRWTPIMTNKWRPGRYLQFHFSLSRFISFFVFFVQRRLEFCSIRWLVTCIGQVFFLIETIVLICSKLHQFWY